MSVTKIIFPETLGSITSAVTFNTTVTRGKNAREVRNAEWQDFLRNYNAAYTVRTLEHIEQLREFFIMVGGRETAFLIKDYLDYEIVEQNLSGVEVPNGTKTDFQIFRAYDDDLGNYKTRNVTFIKSGTLVVSDGDVEWAEGVHYDCDYDTGILTFADAPDTGTEILVSCEYYVPVRMDIDELPIDLLLYHVSNGYTVGQLPNIPMIEVRV